MTLLVLRGTRPSREIPKAWFNDFVKRALRTFTARGEEDANNVMLLAEWQSIEAHLASWGEQKRPSTSIRSGASGPPDRAHDSGTGDKCGEAPMWDTERNVLHYINNAGRIWQCGIDDAAPDILHGKAVDFRRFFARWWPALLTVIAA